MACPSRAWQRDGRDRRLGCVLSAVPFVDPHATGGGKSDAGRSSLRESHGRFRAGILQRRPDRGNDRATRSEEHTSELQSQSNLVCRLLLEKKKKTPDRSQRPCRNCGTTPC